MLECNGIVLLDSGLVSLGDPRKASVLLSSSPPLITVSFYVIRIKRWAKFSGVSGAKSGNLSSYAWALMAIYFLQVRSPPILPSLQIPANSSELVTICGRQCSLAFHPDCARLLSPLPPEVAVLVSEFFYYFQHIYQWGREVVSVRTGKAQTLEQYSLLKGRRFRACMHIEDPIDLAKNLNCVLDWDGANRCRAAFDRSV